METSLHRQLKEVYADGQAQLEAPLGKYRIDVRCGDELVEIQHGSLAAIRDKIRELVPSHRVLLVKPLIVRKTIVKRAKRGGEVISRRQSPKQGGIVDLFHELVYFTRVFPHPNLVLEVPLVEVEEWRYPGHGRRRRWRKDDFQIEDQFLGEIHRIHRFRTAADLVALVPGSLPSPFDTGHLAAAMNVPRWIAQRIAYCFREIGAAEGIGKSGNTRQYRFVTSAAAAEAPRRARKKPAA